MDSISYSPVRSITGLSMQPGIALLSISPFMVSIQRFKWLCGLIESLTYKKVMKKPRGDAAAAVKLSELFRDRYAEQGEDRAKRQRKPTNRRHKLYRHAPVRYYSLLRVSFSRLWRHYPSTLARTRQPPIGDNPNSV